MLDVLCVGHASYDMNMAVARHPGADEKCVADAIQLSGGGPAANAAVQVSRLGGTAAFYGYLGNDLFGDAHVCEFEAEAVDISLLVRGDNASPLSQILAKPDGSRSVVNFKTQRAWLAADAVHIKQPPKVILFDGHEPHLSVPLCQWAKQRSIASLLDAGSLHTGTRELAATVDCLVASESFARHYCETSDMDEALTQLSEICPHVVITLGQRGLIWHHAGALQAYKVAVADSSGAGDAFHGAFALGLARQMTWPALLRFASAAGALTCTRLGARHALPDSAALHALMASCE